MRRIVPASVFALAVIAAACSDYGGPDPYTKSNLTMITSTSGAHPDTNGYRIQITELSPVHMGPNDTVVFDSIQFGDRTFTIDSIASGCAMDSTVWHHYVPAGSSKLVFDISCP